MLYNRVCTLHVGHGLDMNTPNFVSKSLRWTNKLYAVTILLESGDGKTLKEKNDKNQGDTVLINGENSI